MQFFSIPLDSQLQAYNYRSEAAFRTVLQNSVYRGMYQAIRHGSGTLKSDRLFALGRERDSIFIYAKTGTTGYNPRFRMNNAVYETNNKHYLLLITNRRIDLPDFSPAGLKTYTVFIGFYNSTGSHGTDGGHRQAIISAILDSETFKAYWNEN
jgi:hypothetical protein